MAVTGYTKDMTDSLLLSKLDVGSRPGFRLNPVAHPEVTSVALGGASLAQATVTLAATSGTGPNSDYLAKVDAGQGLDWTYVYPGYLYPATPWNFMQHTTRFMTDSRYISSWLYNAGGVYGVEVFVDSRPALAAAGQMLTVGGAQSLNITMANTKPHLVEIRTTCATAGIMTTPNASIWKPASMRGPRCLVVGDSLAAPIVWNPDGTYGLAGYGLYQGMEDWLGVEDWWIDGIGSTGYIARTAFGPYTNTNYVDRLPVHIRINPDILIVSGGGENDLYSGSTVAQVVAAVKDYFTQARAALPNAKLVFLQGFTAPKLFTGYDVQYNQISSALLADPDVQAIGLYVGSTTNPTWLTGTGWAARKIQVTTTNTSINLTGAAGTFNSSIDVGNKISGTGIPAGATIASVASDTSAQLSVNATASGTITATLDATKGDGNSDAYIGADAVHPTVAGHLYLRRRMASLLTRIITDNGELLNTLVS